MAIDPIEIASHSFAMTFINSSPLNATWYKKVIALWRLMGFGVNGFTRCS